MSQPASESQSMELPAPLVMERKINAPIEKVFEAWTKAERVSLWWPPRGFDSPRCEIDPVPGGVMRCDMRGPDGTVYPSAGHYIEVREPDLVVFETEWTGDDGKALLREIVTVTLKAEASETLMTVQTKVVHAEPEAAEALKGMAEGWSQSLEKLGELLASLA